MEFGRTSRMLSAIIFILLQGLISTQTLQAGLSSISQGGGGSSKEYNPVEAAISSSGGGGVEGGPDHSRLISKREATSITEAKGGGARGGAEGGGDASTKEEKKVPPPGAGASGTATSIKLSGSGATSKGPPVVPKTLVIPDRSPANMTSAQMKEESDSEEEEDNRSSSRGRPGKGDFDDKAVQRAIIVIGGIVLIIVAYLGVKFVLFRKAKTVDKRYGRIESSEMDLLDEVEEEEESEEEEELFDINQQRRS